MNSQSVKYSKFVGECISDKAVNDLPGIDEEMAKKFNEHKFQYAYQVLGQLLILDKDKNLFKDFMSDVCDADESQSTECYNCLIDFCNKFL